MVFGRISSSILILFFISISCGEPNRPGSRVSRNNDSENAQPQEDTIPFNSDIPPDGSDDDIKDPDGGGDDDLEAEGGGDDDPEARICPEDGFSNGGANHDACELCPNSTPLVEGKTANQICIDAGFEGVVLFLISQGEHWASASVVHNEGSLENGYCTYTTYDAYTHVLTAADVNAIACPCEYTCY